MIRLFRSFYILFLYHSNNRNMDIEKLHLYHTSKFYKVASKFLMWEFMHETIFVSNHKTKQNICYNSCSLLVMYFFPKLSKIINTLKLIMNVIAQVSLHDIFNQRLFFCNIMVLCISKQM